ncbi:MAG: Na+/H+ antiporter NhaA [Pseudomonadota bacterium]
MQNKIHSIREFLKSQAFGGFLLFFSALFAVVVANSNFASLYHNLFSVSLPLNLSFLSIHKEMNLKLWIDDGLMAVFFLLVGLELKREIVIGELSSKSKIILPFCAAIGGVLLPILIYYFINFGNTENLRGAAIPAATDIAFAIGVLSLFGNKISHSLKIFLVALAIIDDLIAILIIAFFYSDHLDLTYLTYALLTVLLLAIFNKFKVFKLAPYLLVAPFLWVFVLKSGIHPTIAGMLLALFIPLNTTQNSPAKFLEKILHIPITYLVLPIFAFVNSGIVLDNFSLEIFTNKIVLGIMLGLFFGKQLGISLIVYLLQKFKFCKFFKDVSWLEFYGVAVIAGIGFTMSLFIGNLAFSCPDIIDKVRIGVIFGSLFSGLFGFLILAIATNNKNGKLAS